MSGIKQVKVLIEVIYDLNDMGALGEALDKLNEIGAAQVVDMKRVTKKADT